MIISLPTTKIINEANVNISFGTEANVNIREPCLGAAA